MNYGERWGAPFCVGEIDEALARQQYRVYRFSEQAGLVREMTRLNGSLWPASNPESQYDDEDWTRGAARFEYTYNEQGILTRVAQYTPAGQRIRDQLYRFADDKRTGILVFESDLGTSEQQRAEGSRLGALGKDETGRRATIGQHRLSFDGAGYLLERRFEPLGGGGVTSDALGAYGRAYRTNALGLIESIRNLDAVGDTLLEKTGVAEFRREYDEQGRLREVTWRDKAGQLAVNSELFAFLRFTRDDRGRLVRADYFDQDRKLTVRKDSGVASIAYSLDARGNEVEEAYFGVDGQPILRKDWGAARATFTYDARGNTIESAYFGVDDQPTLHKAWGAARVTRAYDASGNAIEFVYFGLNGELIVGRDWGVARVAWAYGARGNIIEHRYFGVDGQPALRKDWGAARVTSAYDAHGNAVEDAYFGVDGQPIDRADHGFHQQIHVYDQKGNNTETTLSRADGRVIYKVKRDFNARDEEALTIVMLQDGSIYEIGLPLLATQMTLARNEPGEHERVAGVARQIAGETERIETEIAGKPGRATASAFGSYAWYALFARAPEDALAAADRAIALGPDQRLWIETNKALALMYLGRADDARAIYMHNRGTIIPQNNNKPWEQVIVEDFAALRAAGLDHPQMAEIEAAFSTPAQPAQAAE